MVRYANFVMLWAASIGLALIFARFATQGLAGTDSHAYWLALQGGEMYGGSPTDRDAYLYSPLFAQVLAPLGWLAWPAFQLVWFGAGAVAMDERP